MNLTKTTQKITASISIMLLMVMILGCATVHWKFKANADAKPNDKGDLEASLTASFEISGSNK